ncbi:EAL domain-containing protein [Vibrio sp. OPT18]|uniref:EAL domain-containing protein n=1 Tax=Vibrio sp. OPT18 TaxID=2778641 RepID=UPI001D153160|nr:EAL domain-containing protein [Vibrio sp. OPT18]
MYKFTNRDGGVLVENGDAFAFIDFLLQPIVTPKDGIIQYYEILSRVTSQTGDNYNSQDFFENKSDDFIKQLCLKQILYSKSFEKDIYKSINITLSCLSDSVFVDKLLLFKDIKIALEVNELNCYTGSKIIIDNIKKIQSRNIMLWLDDYHENNAKANLSLGEISWDIIKIDKSFLHYNSNDSMAIKALSYVLSPFTKYGLIFEGVETSAHSSLVKSVNSLGQGYFYAMPTRKHLKIERDNNEHQI